MSGYLAIGYEIDDCCGARIEPGGRQPGRISCTETPLVRSTFSPLQETDLIQQDNLPNEVGSEPKEIQLGQERFLATRVDLAPGVSPPVQLSVLKSLDQATAFLGRLNRLLLALGLVAVLVGSAMVFIFSHTLTRPLGALVEGVRALGRGDYGYPLPLRGSDEVAEVTAAFIRMRTGLQETQRS